MSFEQDVKDAMMDMDRLNRRIPRALPKAVEDGANVLRREAESLAPYATGLLRESVRIEANGRTANSASHVVAFDVFYARFQEWGTVKMAAQPFLTAAAQTKRQTIIEAVRKAIDAEVQKAVKP